jgi:DNA-binding beta-propeller fold protein YncE
LIARQVRLRKAMHIVAATTLGVTILIATNGTATATRNCPTDSEPRATPAEFTGSKLLVVSDGDMAASAFQDGVLNPGRRERVGNGDTLTVLGLPLQIGVPRSQAPSSTGEVGVENSAIGPPYGVAVSPDGSKAYVLRTRGSAPPGTERVDNIFTALPAPAIVSTVDLSDPTNPEVIQTTRVGRLSHTLSLSPDGKHLAINTDEPNRNIVIREVRPNGLVGDEVLAVHGSETGTPVRRVGRVEWHPSGRFLAHGIPFENEIRFYRFDSAAGKVSLTPFGKPAKVGKFPDEGTFTADGRYYLTTDLHWGDDVPGLFYDPPPGSVTAIRFDAIGGKHRVTGQARTDVSPEGIAVSPDGRFVVTENLVRSWKPWHDPRLSPGGSINLLELDQTTGKLTTRQRVPVDGILPEGITFDAEGTSVAATVFDHYDPRVRRGSVRFFTLERGRCPGLVATNVELQVPAGAHMAYLVP